ncbi:hypothetical protein CCS38_29500 [Streptomyces purpurogeneiscleroticus]|nr:hypothetical protein [Streptomyces purpurogeneiscleroticus]
MAAGLAVVLALLGEWLFAVLFAVLFAWGFAWVLDWLFAGVLAWLVAEVFAWLFGWALAAGLCCPWPSWAPGCPSSSGRGCVSHTAAAPATAIGHSMRPATPSSPAPVYAATRRPRGDTTPTAFSAPSAAFVTSFTPGT